MRSNVQRMLYSPERSSLAGTAQTGSVLPQIILPAGVHSGKRHTSFGVKDGNGSSMGRGYTSIGKQSAFLLRTLPLLLLCCFAAFSSITAHAQSANQTAKEKSKSAKTWDKEGQAAEARHDFDTAFEDYQHALNLKPTDLRYQDNFDRMRFQAAASHVDQGRVLRQSGDLNGALAQFTRALEIDPSYQTAQQEIDQVKQQIANQANAAPP